MNYRCLTPSSSSDEHYLSDDDHDVVEPIAVCGIGFRFPQDAVSEEGFWKMLLERRSVRTEFPPDRLNINSFHHPTRRNELCTRGGHFLQEDLGKFDADFFSITPSEAAAMDPMQRLLLETTVEALDTAGIRMEDLHGSRTSVHTGCFSNDYLHQLLKDPQRLPPYTAVGASQSMLANRISWFFNLKGPSFNIDSACSSSALAIDCACRLLLSGQTDIGLAAGCNLTLDPDYSIILSNNQMLSPDGRSYAFDHRANGYARGEGVGVLILKRLSDALRDNDTIRAVIRATSSNQDGHTPSITQPASEAQAQLIRETYAEAGLSLQYTRFFEAHGTGTSIGDPAEVSAIAECFRKYRTADSPLYLGAVKTNIGHLEGASGIAGVIKAILAVERGIIPPNTNFEKLHPQLRAYDSYLTIPSSQGIPWPSSEVRRASINSFGYGGSNCHIVLDDAASYLRRHQLQGNHLTMPGDDNISNRLLCRPYHTNSSATASRQEVIETPRLLVWSAASEKSLNALVDRWEKAVADKNQRHISWAADAAYTLDSRRSVLPWKSFAVVSSSTEWDQLKARVSSSKLTSPSPPRLAFVFTGQGAQWFAMGRDLINYPVFAQVLMEADILFRQLGCSWSVQEEFLKSEAISQINEAHISQALTATLQIALIDLLESFQVRPSAVVGHSMGEIAAAYCAGFISRVSALRIAYYRGYFIASMIEQGSNKGSMLAVGMSATETQLCMAKLPEPEKVVVACINSPTSSTISGDESQIELLRQMLEEAGVFARQLKVPAAYHSPQMQRIAGDCLRHFTNLEEGHLQPTIPMISTITAQPLDGERARQGSYWLENLLSPVLFAPAIQRLCRDSPDALRKKLDGSHQKAIVVDHLIEIGPHAALKLPISETIATLEDKQGYTYLSALVRGQSATTTLLSLLGQLYCAGTRINLRVVNDPKCHKARIALADAPTYPFDHSESFWAESHLSRDYRLRPHGRLALLGSMSQEWNPLAPEWRNCVRVADMPWIRDHRINRRIIYPAAAMMVMALQATRQLVNTGHVIEAYVLRRVQFHRPISVDGSGNGISDDLETRLRLDPISLPAEAVGTLRWKFTVHSLTGENAWQENCQGVVELHVRKQEKEHEERVKDMKYQRQWAKKLSCCTIQVPASQIYDHLKSHGFHYGPSVQGITATQTDGIDTALATLNLTQPYPASPDFEEYPIHPASLDAFLQLSLVAQTRGVMKGMPTQVISSIDRLWIAGNGWTDNPEKSQKLVSAAMQVKFDGVRTKTYGGYILSPTANGQRVQLVLDRLETTAVSSVDQEVTSSGIAVLPSHNHESLQSYYTIKTDLAVEASTPNQILQHLTAQCGIDPAGPREFFRDVRKYLTIQVQKIYRALNRSEIPNKPHFLRYAAWMEMQLTQQGLSPLQTPETHEEVGLQTRISAQGPLGRFYLTVADHALGVLHGQVDIVQLLFESNLVNDFYAYQSPDSLSLRKTERYIAAKAFTRPNLDILEVGAGTGSFTEHILNGIGSSETSLSSYHYTDISPAFFERAQQRFSSHPQSHRIAFRLLDAERDPIEQGFTAQSYDLIVASNALHVTRNLGVTLTALRRLLRPGGELILHEVTRPENIEVGFVFGLLPGWWPEATDDRPMSPVVSEARWNQIMQASGYVGAELVMPDYADEECQLMSVMVATVAEVKTGSTKDSPKEEILLVIDASSELQVTLADRLKHLLPAIKETYQPRVVIYPQQLPSGSVIISLLDLDTSVLENLDGTESFEHLKAMLLGAGKVLWISKHGDPAFGMINGFAQVFRIENPQIPFQILHMDADSGRQHSADLHSISIALDQLITESLSCREDYIIRNNQAYVHRIQEDVPLKTKINGILDGYQTVSSRLHDVRPFTVDLASSGNLEVSLIHNDEQNSQASRCLGPDEVEIAVRALRLEGQIDRIRQFAGRITQVGRNSRFLIGDRVCGTYYSSGNSLTSTIRTHRRLVARIAPSLSFTEAVVLPQRYLIADYLDCLISASAKTDPVVIIHGAHTSFARILVRFLANRLSKLILTVESDSEGTEFGDQTINKSISVSTYSSFLKSSAFSYSGDAADIVLDFMDSDLLDLADQVASFGTIIRVGNENSRSASGPNQLWMPANISLHTVDVAQVLQHKLMQLRMPSVIGAETISAPAVGSVKLSKLLSQSSLSTGWSQVTIEFDDDDLISIRKPVQPADVFDPDVAYLVAGGLGDLGRCVTQWMAERGARHLILLSRSGPRTEVAQTMIKELEYKGVKVFAPACDITDITALQRILYQCNSTMPPIKGCIQMTGVLRDVMYNFMTFIDWRSSVQPKVSGSWNLHTLLPRGMNFFILASSLTGLIGHPTQINYAAANAYQDALAHYRLSKGERAVSLDLGLLETKGLLSQTPELIDRLLSTNFHYLIRKSNILALLEHFCDPNLGLDELPAQVATGFVRPSQQRELLAMQLPVTLDQPFWKQIYVPKDHNSNNSRLGHDNDSNQPDHLSLHAALSAAASATNTNNERSTADALAIITSEALAERFCQMVLMPRTKLDLEQPLHRAGADSLTAVDLRNWVFKELGVDLPVFDILGDLPLSALGKLLAREWALLHPA